MWPVKILIISRSEWDTSNSTGNTLENLFGGYSADMLANLYFRTSPPRSNVCREFFSLTEWSAFHAKGGHFFKERSVGGGSESRLGPARQRGSVTARIEQAIVGHLRTRRSLWVLTAQSLYWALGWWKNARLRNFLRTFGPDLVFCPSFENPYVHWVVSYVVKLTGAKLVLFHADDYFFKYESCRSVSECVYGYLVRRAISKSIDVAAINYCISRPQANSYQLAFRREFPVLVKGAVFPDWTDDSSRGSARKGRKIRLVYAGSLLHGRWKTLAVIVNTISKMTNADRFMVDVYSQYPAPDEVVSALTIPTLSRFFGAVSQTQLDKIVRNADALIHVESFDESDKSSVRYSFSTKIIDSLASGRALIGVGPADIASIAYLAESKAAYVAVSESEISDVLEGIGRNPSQLAKMAARALQYCRDHHDLSATRLAFDRALRGALASAEPGGTP